MDKYHVSVAAEACAAAAFARAGFEVSVQYGANQPGYDLIAAKGPRMMKVSVKGSSDGGWIIHARYKTGPKVSYRQALDAWLAAQPLQVVFFYVQFYGVPFGDMPRCYVARAADVYAHMLTTRGGHIAGSLVERYAYSRRGAGAGTTDTIPPSWELTEARLDAV